MHGKLASVRKQREETLTRLQQHRELLRRPRAGPRIPRGLHQKQNASLMETTLLNAVRHQRLSPSHTAAPQPSRECLQGLSHPQACGEAQLPRRQPVKQQRRNPGRRAPGRRSRAQGTSSPNGKRPPKAGQAMWCTVCPLWAGCCLSRMHLPGQIRHLSKRSACRFLRSWLLPKRGGTCPSLRAGQCLSRLHLPGCRWHLRKLTACRFL